jgi:hypothetical protein
MIHRFCSTLARVVASCFVVALALSAAGSQAKAQQGGAPPAGVLRCDVSGGIGFIFGSTRSLECVYSSTQGGSEFYQGQINKFGIDIGFLKSGVIVWSVVAPGVNVSPGLLAGRYVGVSAQVAAVRGVGANALISGNKVMLNPLSVEGLKGVNVAAGISGLKLNYVSRPNISRPLPLPR